MLPNFSRGMLKKQPRHFFFKELTQNYVLNNVHSPFLSKCFRFFRSGFLCLIIIYNNKNFK